MTTLDQIVEVTRKRVSSVREDVSAGELERAAAKHTPRGFREALLRASTSGPAVIAELKKASPSQGEIRGSFPVGRLAQQLEQGGAAALSVLTEEVFFQGSLANLREASAATSLPCLRKDFIVDEYQLIEARANAADAVLLIVAALDDAQLRLLHARARELHLDVLVEVHDEAELARAIALGADIIGVNSRDLRTLAVDMGTPVRLAPQLPRTALRIAESGLNAHIEIRNLGMIGYQGFLIGTSLMKAEDPGAALQQLIASAKAPPLGASGVARWSAGTRD